MSLKKSILIKPNENIIQLSEQHSNVKKKNFRDWREKMLETK